ncbi:MAG: cytochrome P450 [Pseudomonadota bacterium]
MPQAPVDHAENAIPDHVPSHLVVDFDYIADPQLQVDPFDVLMRLRNGLPLVYTPRNGGHWIATRHEVIREIFHAHDIFSNFPRIIPKTVSQGATAQPFSDIDPPENQKYRRLLQEVLMPRAIQEFETKARRIMIELVDEIAPTGRCDFAVEVAQKLPIYIIMEWLDLPWEDRFQLMENTDNVLSHPDPEKRRAAKAANFAYVDGVVAARRANPGKDLISHLATGKVDGRPVTHEEGRAMAANLVAGGLDTVRNMMSYIALFLATHPAHRRELIEDPGLIPGAVEELLRYNAITNMSRSVARDVVFNGVVMKAGDMMLLPLSLAGRDGEASPSPLDVDFRRSPNRHLTFGSGAHLCPGMHLARIELKVFLEEWLRRVPDFRLAEGQAPVTRGGVILAVRALPLCWDA